MSDTFYDVNPFREGGDDGFTHVMPGATIAGVTNQLRKTRSGQLMEQLTKRLGENYNFSPSDQVRYRDILRPLLERDPSRDAGMLAAAIYVLQSAGYTFAPTQTWENLLNIPPETFNRLFVQVYPRLLETPTQEQSVESLSRYKVNLLAYIRFITGYIYSERNGDQMIERFMSRLAQLGLTTQNITALRERLSDLIEQNPELDSEILAIAAYILLSLGYSFGPNPALQAGTPIPDPVPDANLNQFLDVLRPYLPIVTEATYLQLKAYYIMLIKKYLIAIVDFIQNA